MALPNIPITFSTRIKQFLCRHETTSMAAYTEGVNSKEGYVYVVYQCGKCKLCYGRWEKKEDINW